jgi:hypothetical protein
MIIAEQPGANVGITQHFAKYVTVFLNMASTKLAAMLARKAVGDRGKLGSGRTKSFVSGGCPEGLAMDKRSLWKT